jgi:hypothetical protein
VKNNLRNIVRNTTIIVMYSARIEGGGGAQGDGAPLIFFFFCVPNYIFSPERGDATFILIDVQNNFYVNFNLRQFENEFYDLYYQNYFYD